MKQKKFHTIEEIKEKMANYCAYRERCHWEVEQKLNEFFLIPQARDEVLLFLIKNKFLNEERFVKDFVYGKFYFKQWGRIKIKAALTQRKITHRLQEQAINSQIREQDYRDTLKKLSIQKMRQIKANNSYEKKGKLIRYLLQKGYEYGLITEVLEEVL